MPVFHRPDIPQRSGEERHQVVFVPPGRHCGEHLIKVQVAEHRRVLALDPVGRTLEQDAAERCRIHVSLRQHVARQKPSAAAAVRGELHRLAQFYLTVMVHAAPLPTRDGDKGRTTIRPDPLLLTYSSSTGQGLTTWMTVAALNGSGRREVELSKRVSEDLRPSQGNPHIRVLSPYRRGTGQREIRISTD